LTSADAQQRFVVFNIVAFGANFVSGISSLQANQVSYRQIVEAAMRRKVPKEAVDLHLLALMERGILFTQVSKRGAITLSASAFLHGVKYAQSHEPLHIHPYEQIKMDSQSQIEPPAFLFDADYALANERDTIIAAPLPNSDAESGDFVDQLRTACLERIDSTLLAQPCSQQAALIGSVFQFIAFGDTLAADKQRDETTSSAAVMERSRSSNADRLHATGVSFGQLCRFGLASEIDYERLIDVLKLLLKHYVIQVYVEAITHEVSLTASAFVRRHCRANRLPLKRSIQNEPPASNKRQRQQ